MARLFRRTRVRLTFVYSALFLSVACLASIGFWTAFDSFEYGTVDSTLRSQADLVAVEIADAPGPLQDLSIPAQTRSGIGIATFVFGPDGQIAVKNQSAVSDAEAIALRPASGFPARSLIVTRSVGEGTARVLARRIPLPAHETGGVILIRPIDELQARLSRTAVSLAIGVGGLVIAAALLAYWLAGRALRPVREMSAAARAISEQHLERRLQANLPAGDELGELAATFNELLARLEAAFGTLQRFTADAAHELRAPLALMRTQIEVMLRHPRTADELRESHRSLLAEIDRLTKMADQLLLLARADAGALAPRLESYDLPDLLEEVADRWLPVAASKRVGFTTSFPAEGRVLADEILIRRLLDNLLDNAFRYAGAGGAVRFSGERERGFWRLTVSDSGPGVPQESRPQLFERYFRADPARARSTGGAGLGLALSAAIARAHGGTIELVESGCGLKGACFVVKLPIP